MGIRRHKPEKIVTEVAAGWRPHSRPKPALRQRKGYCGAASRKPPFRFGRQSVCGANVIVASPRLWGAQR